MKLILATILIQLSAFGAAPFYYYTNAEAMVAQGPTNLRHIAIVVGVSSENDGHGGYFIFDTNSTAEANATNVFERGHGSGGRWVRLTAPEMTATAPVYYSRNVQIESEEKPKPKGWTLSEIALAQILFLIGAGAGAIVLIVATRKRTL